MNQSVVILAGSLLLLWGGCKPESDTAHQPTDSPFSPQGSQADLVYNPVRPDGTIDSSYLPVLTWDQDRFHFGEILEGDVVTHEFTFTNTGTAPLLIQQATSTCGCTIPEWPKEQIAPGDKGRILVKFSSLHKTGQQSKEVTIFANTFPNQTRVTIEGRVAKTN